MRHFFIGFTQELEKLAKLPMYTPQPLKPGESRVTRTNPNASGKKDQATGLRPGEGRTTTRPVTQEEKRQWSPQ